MDKPFDPSWLKRCEPVAVYKQDRRSRVWRIDPPGGRSFVVKRFEYWPMRQVFAAALGVHPGQRERRCEKRLRAADVDVVPIIASGMTGMKLWLATPFVGKSLHNLFFHGDLDDGQRRERVLRSAGELTGTLIRKGFFNRDHKASNILVDEADRARLIDYGAVRRLRGPGDRGRMMAGLCANLTEAGATGADLEQLRQACDSASG